MPFGLSNVPRILMRLMRHVFQPFSGKFLVVYFEDILVYSRSNQEHKEHLKDSFWNFEGATTLCLPQEMPIFLLITMFSGTYCF
ncbi:hypothetical protein Pint_17823 [Pistacia integerrima]|uniref:Uncharacterized protein n=1 Tax=Pistacia integerrima TaxID=434235 RepID=A0ACC0YZW5_9ROSI|nr:hypothetical protein Pint_17823 [Pistacia integerrima]